MENVTEKPLDELSGCQIPCIPRISEGKAKFDRQPMLVTMKRVLARPWNYYVKKFLKRAFFRAKAITSRAKIARVKKAPEGVGTLRQELKPGEWVRIRTREEIEATLNPWKELKGCAFLADMWRYCGTNQKVLKSMQRFLDERDYQVKKCKGVVLLENVLCQGTPVFGPCDRCCHFFWREEWLEKLPVDPSQSS
jgi:hypothetical protein